MYKFLESICFKSGAYQSLAFHQNRIDETFKKYFTEERPIQLEKALPSLHGESRKKVRLTYDNNQFETNVQEYIPKAISKLKIIDADKLNYSFKFADRSPLNELFDQKGIADDILIIQEGKVTDSSYANLIFWNGSEWFTPTSYLLNGVKRKQLIQQGFIKERVISENDLDQYSKVGLINAMLDPNEITIPISKVAR